MKLPRSILFSRVGIVAAATLGAAISCSPTNTELADSSRPTRNTPQQASQESQARVIGVVTHLMWGTHPVELQLRAIHDSGVTSLRDDARWVEVEQEKGVLQIPSQWDTVVDEARASGIAPLLILDYGNPLYDRGDKPRSQEAIAAFTRYSRFVVEHFKGRVAYYEIWNEWDHTMGGTSIGTPEEYVRLIRSVYPKLKEADPSAQILAGSMTPGGVRGGFLQRIVELGAVEFSDGLSLHTYVHCHPYSRPEDWAEWMANVQSELTNLTGEVQRLYVTEMGWPSNRGECGRTPQKQADYLARLFLLSRTLPFIRGIWWYDLKDDGTDPFNPKHNFGLLNTDLSPKPALTTLGDLAPIAQNAKFLGQVETGYPSLRALRFVYEGDEIVAFWSDTEEHCFRLQKVSSTDSEDGATDVLVGATPKLTRGFELTDGTASASKVPCEAISLRPSGQAGDKL